MQLAARVKSQGVEPLIVAVKGQTDKDFVSDYPHVWVRIGAAGAMIKALKKNDVKDIVMIGAMKRPRFWELWPDFRAFLFYTRIGFRALGDNGLLSAVRKELEHEGFHLHGIHKFLPELLTAEGCLTAVRPSVEDTETIRLGLRESQRIGMADIGQAVIVEGDQVLGLEDKKGTNALIRRVQPSGHETAILVKTCKPQQDRDLDLPTIGPATVENCMRAGVKGIIIEAGAGLVSEREKLVELANRYGIFVCAVNIRDYL